jgi:thioredoxin 1
MKLSEFKQRASSSQKPLVVDFWAPWCAPCRATKPVLEKLAREFDQSVVFLPINADESQDVLKALKIHGIPTVIAIRDGKEAGRVVGVRSESGYRAIFDALVAGTDVKVPITPFDRLLRLGAGTLFVMIGLSASNWLVVAMGAILAFMGVYDRCPIWRAMTDLVKREKKLS